MVQWYCETRTEPVNNSPNWGARRDTMNTYGMHALSLGAGALALTVALINIQPAIYQALISVSA